jgi:hypothetical protein
MGLFQTSIAIIFENSIETNNTNVISEVSIQADQLFTLKVCVLSAIFVSLSNIRVEHIS